MVGYHRLIGTLPMAVHAQPYVGPREQSLIDACEPARGIHDCG